MMALAGMTLEELACESGAELLSEGFHWARNAGISGAAGAAGSSVHISVATALQEPRNGTRADS
jgi:hypothetical protein